MRPSEIWPPPAPPPGADDGSDGASRLPYAASLGRLGEKSGPARHAAVMSTPSSPIAAYARDGSSEGMPLPPFSWSDSVDGEMGAAGGEVEAVGLHSSPDELLSLLRLRSEPAASSGWTAVAAPPRATAAPDWDAGSGASAPSPLSPTGQLDDAVLLAHMCEQAVAGAIHGGMLDGKDVLALRSTLASLAALLDGWERGFEGGDGRPPPAHSSSAGYGHGRPPSLPEFVPGHGLMRMPAERQSRGGASPSSASVGAAAMRGGSSFASSSRRPRSDTGGARGPTCSLWIVVEGSPLFHIFSDGEVRLHFEQFGALESIACASGGYAFVNYYSVEDSSRAFRASQGMPWAGGVLKVQWAQSKRPAKAAYMEARGDGRRAAAFRAAAAPPAAFSQLLAIGIEPDSEFHIARRIIGYKGAHMKAIVNEARGAHLRLRGRGSAAADVLSPAEAAEPLQLSVSASHRVPFELALAMAEHLIAHVRQQYCDARAGNDGRLADNLEEAARRGAAVNRAVIAALRAGLGPWPLPADGPPAAADGAPRPLELAAPAAARALQAAMTSSAGRDVDFPTAAEWMTLHPTALMSSTHALSSAPPATHGAGGMPPPLPPPAAAAAMPPPRKSLDHAAEPFVPRTHAGDRLAGSGMAAGGIGDSGEHHGGHSGADMIGEDRINELVQLRDEARRVRNYVEADRIRDYLSTWGVVLMDAPSRRGGTTWRYWRA
eukprot:PLAT2941.1.p1 GENE.PLAT2941.1~~PLAT2941.1.p1  ORF type:complete len:717 (+),score=278.58 PLAT2941.1:43-2193(+)